MFQRILVAIDGSDASNRAIDTAAGMAGRFGSEVHLVHVMMKGKIPAHFVQMAEVEGLIDSREQRSPGAGPLPAGMTPTLEQNSARGSAGRLASLLGEHLLDRARRRIAKAGVRDAQRHFVEGDTAEQILKVARQIDAELVVMGTRGLSELKGLMLGSVSHKILQLSGCPCLTVK